MMTRTPTENDLQAYVDNQLDESRRLWVERYLAQHPEAAKRVADWQSETQRLRVALAGDESLAQAQGPQPQYSQPQVIRRQIRSRRQMRWALAFTLILSLGGGGVAGWQLRDMDMQRHVLPMEDAVRAYQMFSRDKLPVLDVVADNRGAMNNWLSRYFINGAMPPNLEEYGFTLLGGRLMATDAGPSALIVYQDRQGVRVTYYIRPSGHNGLRSGKREAGNLLAQYWSDNKYNYAMVSPVNNSRAQPVQNAIAAYTAAAHTL
ncbi:anti-sigma factor family protein [Acerihabitans arboris]|uniref:Anti-sigma factor n=1 Tax=Acerihabitans arboris TaxID=2691583 RepID=A0A845SQL8_9GAMM|nr:anti-sigma factor [Acerihabitans arboris]NDL65234.1 anti-sigma factor [Acerihabitans arboris]